MTPHRKKTVLFGLVALCGLASADIPGVFVIQGARIDDPITASAATGKRFGSSGIAWVGDLNDDQVQDVILGAGKSFSDTGSLQIVKLDKAGKAIGSPVGITSRDPKIKPYLSQVSAPDNFGGSVEVVQRFSHAENCAVVVTASTNKAKIWAIKACRDGSGASVSSVSAIDSLSSPILQGFGTPRIGESIRVIDTLSSGVVVLALSVPAAVNNLTKTALGAVLLVGLNPTTLAWSKVGQLPSSWDATDPVMGNLSGSASGFGRSVARITKTGAGVRLAVSSTGDKPQARIHVIDLDDNYAVTSATSFLPTVGAESVLGLYSISSADFNHDGILDLAIGQPQKAGKNLVGNVGGFSIALMNAQGAVSAIKQYGQADGGGFVDTSSSLVEKSYFGIDLLAGEFDGDNQADVVVCASGTTGVSSSVWPLRMKSLPWQLKQPDTINLVANPVLLNLSEYIQGNSLKWSIAEVNPPSTGSLSSCGIIQSAGETSLRCLPFATNGISKWKVTASDTGNVPSSDHFQLEMTFVVRVKDQNVPPTNTATPLPAKVVVKEDHSDTAILVLSNYFTDPDLKPLRFDLTPLNGSVAPLLNYYQSANYDTLRVKPVPLKFGLCSLQIAAKDDAGAVLLDTIVIQVEHVNHVPVAADDAYEIVESTGASFDVAVNDKDVDIGDPIVYAISDAPVHGKVSVQGDKILYTPDSFYLGLDSIRYRMSDASASSLAWVRITVSKTTAPLKIYRAMRDTSVNEGAPSILVQVDSLFFSGTLRFNVSVYEAAHSCQGIATVVHDRAASKLTISPLPSAFGSCKIWVKESAEGKLADTMNIELKPVLSPYKFKEDTIRLEMTKGQHLTFKLDTVDLDKDSLMYTALSLPSWARLDAYSIEIDPASDEGKLVVVASKKPLPNVTYLDPSDTLVVYAMFGTASLRLRAIGNNGMTLSKEGNRLVLVGGTAPYEVQFVSLDGRVVHSANGREFERKQFELKDLPRASFLRLVEGGRTNIAPLFIHR